MNLLRKWSKTFKRDSSHTSIYEMDYCGINKIGFMFQKGDLGMCSWRNVMMGPLHAMVAQNTPKHSSRSPTIGLIWKMMQRNMWRFGWFINKIEHSIRNKRDYCDHYPFLKGHWKVCPWISWWVCHHQGDLMRSWWWWINLIRWHTLFSPRKVPWPKRREGCSSCTCSNIMASQRTLCWIKTQSSRASFGEPCGSAWHWSSRWAPLSNPKQMDKPREWTWLSNNS